MGFNLKSGLHYNWHRHYDPSTGRYLQPDPLGMPDGPSRYAYALNSPQMAVDPEGLYVESAIELISLGIGASSFVDNLRQGELGAAGVDFCGILLDVGALALPVIPGGAGFGIMAARSGGTPFWSSTGTKSAVQNAFDHYKKHKQEFPEFRNAKEYTEGAKKFLNNPPKGTLTKNRANGDTLMYNPGSNTFGVKNSSGAPKTLFRPSGGMSYWNRQ